MERHISDRGGHRALHPTRIDIPSEIRLYLVTLLNQTLACTVDLRSQAKQASWNVKGKEGSQLQALFESIATELDAYANLLADRLVVLGGVALGTARTAARQSTLPEYPSDLAAGDAHTWRWRSASPSTPQRCGTPLRAPRMSAMRIQRPSTPTSRAGSIGACAPWNRISTREPVTGP